MLNVLTSARKESTPPTPSIHRLRSGLPGYLIPFAPLTFAPQCQIQARKTPSPPVFFPISTHFTATLEIPLSPPVLKTCSIRNDDPVERGRLLPDLQIHLRALYAQ